MVKQKICPELFLSKCFDPCLSQGRFFLPIFRLQKVDLHVYMGKCGITHSSYLLSSPFHRENL